MAPGRALRFQDLAALRYPTTGRPPLLHLGWLPPRASAALGGDGHPPPGQFGIEILSERRCWFLAAH